MAQEDLLPQMFAEFYAKANPDPPSDNQQLQKIEVPSDQITVSLTTQTYTGPASLQQDNTDKVAVGVSPYSNAVDPSTFTWGGYALTPSNVSNSTPVSSQTPTDTSNTMISAGWYWGYGGAWK